MVREAAASADWIQMQRRFISGEGLGDKSEGCRGIDQYVFSYGGSEQYVIFSCPLLFQHLPHHPHPPTPTRCRAFLEEIGFVGAVSFLGLVQFGELLLANAVLRTRMRRQRRVGCQSGGGESDVAKVRFRIKLVRLCVRQFAEEVAV